MCIDGDNAGHAAEFVNAQLHALHKIAGDCVAHYEGQDIDRSAQPGYDFAFREYYYKSKTHPPVKFEFGAPQIEFVCNHDAILHITIQNVTGVSTSFESSETSYSGNGLFISGSTHLTKDIKFTEGSYSEVKTLSHLKGTVSVRIPFAKYKLSGQSELFGNGKHDIHSFILGLSKGYFVRAGTTTHDVATHHRPYLEAYLHHLVKSGHHIIYSLPQFDDDNHKHEIDFSTATVAAYDHVTTAFGIELSHVTKYVEDAWLKAAWLAHEHKHDSKTQIEFSIRNTIAVAKWERSWRTSAPFDVEFGAPTIQFLCDHEAILTFSLENVVFYSSDGREVTYQNWKIAIIVDIIHEVQQDGAISILKIHTGKYAKFAQHLSIFGGCDFEDDIDWVFLQTLVSFITQEYLIILQDGGFHLSYHDSRIIHYPGSGRKELWIGTVEESDYATKITTTTEMYGFQQVIALSHASLNNIFYGYYLERGWMRHSNEDGFEIHFGAPKVRLLSNKRALVFIHLKTGTLKTGNHDHDKHTFEDWTLAFEVTLGIRDVDLSRPSDFREFRETQVYKSVKDWKHSYLKQLYIDFEGAKFNYQLSTFNDKNFGKNNFAIRKVIAINSYLKEYYLRQIKDASTDILYSIVISKDESITRPRYAFFDATFHIYSSVEITHQNYNILSPAEEPLIVILGTTNPKTPLPGWSLRYSGYWMCRPGISLGTLALSSDVFLNGRLIPLLASINRVTTLVPASLDMDRGNWLVSATTWLEKHKKDGDHCVHPTEWELIPSMTPNAFEYKWDHSDEYEYSHEGARGDRSSGTYFLSLKTDNHLTIPTSFRAGQLDIVIRGTSSISLGWSRADNNAKHHASVSWTIVISAVTDANGLRIKIDKQFAPNYESRTEGFITSDESHRIRDPISILKPIFPVTIGLETELQSLKKFENIWYSFYPGLKAYKLANPFFTAKGDLFLELYEHDQPIAQTITSASGRPTTRPLLNRPSPIKSKGGSIPGSPRTPIRSPLSAFGSAGPITGTMPNKPLFEDAFTAKKESTPPLGNGAAKAKAAPAAASNATAQAV